MLVKGRGRPTYLLSKNPQIKLWHRRLGHASNAKVVEAFKLNDGIDITIEKGQQIQEEPFSFDSNFNDEDKNSEPSPASNTPPTPATMLLNKVTSTGTDPDHSIEQLCDPCIESKHKKIVKHKKMTPTTSKLEEIHADLWGPHDPSLLSERIYIGLFLNEFIRKSWVLLLSSKDEFFDAFKLWLPRVGVYGEKIRCLKTDVRGEFISTAIKSFCKERSITIGYAAPYIHEENGIAEQCWRTLAIIKNLLLINSSLPVNFWAEAMDTANYLCNQLPTRRGGPSFIPEEPWTSKKQNLEHLQIFGSSVSTLIPNKKRIKSDMRKI